MITEAILKSAKKYVSKGRLRSVIYDELIRNKIYNYRTGKPYSKDYIYEIMKGEKSNMEIENVILNLIKEMKDKHEAIKKDYRESLENQSH